MKNIFFILFLFSTPIIKCTEDIKIEIHDESKDIPLNSQTNQSESSLSDQEILTTMHQQPNINIIDLKLKILLFCYIGVEAFYLANFILRL